MRLAFDSEKLADREMVFDDDMKFIELVSELMGQPFSDERKTRSRKDFEACMKACSKCPEDALAGWSERRR